MKHLPLILALFLTGCATAPDPAKLNLDHDCVTRKIGTRILTKAIGFGLGAAIGPAGGLASKGVGLAVNPQCNMLKPEAAQEKPVSPKPVLQKPARAAPKADKLT